MENSGDGDQACGVVHFVENPVVANAEPEIAAAAFQPLDSGKPRVLRQLLEAVTNSIENVRGQGGEVALRTRGQLDSVSH
jgi:hypothetical protein